MTFQPAHYCAGVALVHRIDSQNVINTLTFSHAGATWSAAGLSELLDLIVPIWATTVVPNFSSALSFVRAEARDLSTEDSFVVVNRTDLPANGDHNAAFIPTTDAFVLSLRTGRSGRSYRGRTYFGGIATEDVTGNRFHLAVADAVQLAVAALFAAVVSSGIAVPVVLSRVSDGVRRAVAIGTPITSVLYVTDVLGNQRRRRPGVGD